MDIPRVELAGLGEVLQTATHPNPFSGLVEGLLVPGFTELIWRQDGPGRGSEMRRAFSGLFGRFFARAYLDAYHGFTQFAPIDREVTNVSSRVRVVRRASAGDMPDWLCRSGGSFIIGEAKGSRARAKISYSKLPGPLGTAQQQIGRAEVQVRRRVHGISRWVPVTAKGWAVMCRWATEDNGLAPVLYALDPSSPGEEPSSDEIVAISHDIALFHYRELLRGLGFSEESSVVGLRLGLQESSPAAPSRERVRIDAHGLAGTEFVGSVLTPFGITDAPVAQVRDALAGVSGGLPGQMLFVGLDLDTVTRVMEGNIPIDRKFMAIAADHRSAVQGSDGLVLSPLSLVVPAGRTQI